MKKCVQFFVLSGLFFVSFVFADLPQYVFPEYINESAFTIFQPNAAKIIISENAMPGEKEKLELDKQLAIEEELKPYKKLMDTPLPNVAVFEIDDAYYLAALKGTDLAKYYDQNYVYDSVTLVVDLSKKYFLLDHLKPADIYSYNNNVIVIPNSAVYFIMPFDSVVISEAEFTQMGLGKTINSDYQFEEEILNMDSQYKIVKTSADYS